MSRASSDLVDLIHMLAATALHDELARVAERAALPLDDENYAPINPQLIDKALKFLKDCGPGAELRSGGRAADGLYLHRIRNARNVGSDA